MKQKRIFMLLIGFSLIALVGFGLAGCGQSEPEASEEMAAGPRELRATFSWPTFIDPGVGTDNSSSSAVVNLYDTLVFPTADGNVIPWLAESWDVSADGRVWDFKLREGVMFHDGTELLASDVVYTFDRLTTVGEGFGYLFTTVAGATVVDDYTVQFTLDQGTGLFLPSLVRLYVLNEDLVRANTAAEGAYGADGDYGKAFLLNNDAGSGPYQVSQFQLEEYLVMSQYTDWWGDFAPNAPEEVRFIAATEAATIRTLMSNGELEISDQWQSVDALKNLAELDGVSVAALPTFMEFYLMMNTRVAPLDDLAVRRAVSYAFDYETALSLEWPGTKQSVGPVPQALGGHNPNVVTFDYDVDKAREELAQSRYADTIGDYTIEIHWISEVPDEEKFALLFQANMAEIGIDVDVVSSPWLSVVENTAAPETSPNLVMIYIPSDMAEAGPLLRLKYHSSTAPTWSQNEWLLDADLDAALDDALATVDVEERFAKYAELQDRIAELAPALYLYDAVEKHAYQDYVDWPAAKGAVSPLTGYYLYAADIGINN
jgi:peptide/nickel transport system substrate-binding protein